MQTLPQATWHRRNVNRLGRLTMDGRWSLPSTSVCALNRAYFHRLDCQHELRPTTLRFRSQSWYHKPYKFHSQMILRLDLLTGYSEANNTGRWRGSHQKERFKHNDVFVSHSISALHRCVWMARFFPVALLPPQRGAAYLHFRDSASQRKMARQ